MKYIKNPIVTKFISQFIDNEDDSLFIESYATNEDKISFPGFYNFKECLNKSKPINFVEYFRDKGVKKYSLIIAELPFLKKLKEEKDFSFKIREDWVMIYKLLNKLKNNGVLLVETMPNFGVTIQSKRFIQSLRDKSFFITGLIEAPKYALYPLSNLQPNIAIFTRQDNHNRLFISSLDEADSEQVMFNNFTDFKVGLSLKEGDIVETTSFRGFLNYKVNKKIEKLQTQYKEFEKITLKDLLISINTTKDMFVEKDNCLYIRQLGDKNIFSNIEQLKGKHSYYLQLEIDTKVAKSKYLEAFLKSEMGQLSLESLLFAGTVSKFSKHDLQEILIPLPPMENQKKIITSYLLLESTSDVISKLEKNLSLNPKNSNVIIEKLTDALISLNQLTTSDKILYLLRQGENLTIEYKQTFSLDVKTGKKEKYIEDSSLKNIVGFLNKKGGTLLIGVSDDSEIYGIEKDLYQSDDKYLLHFKNKVKTAIGEEFFDLINYEIVDINGKKILLVECSKSLQPVYLYGEHFYVRTNPATDKLEGPKLVNYIRSHFKS